MIKIVFFDFDGVLTLNGHACNEISGYLEHITKIPISKIEPTFHNVANQLLVNGKRYNNYIDSINKELGTSLTGKDILDAVKKSKHNYKMIKILRDLRNNHIRVGILTDNNIERLEMIREHPEFRTLSPIVGSSEVGCTKDKCDEIFKEAIRQAKVRPEESIFVDNKRECLEIPTRMGFHTFLHDEVRNDVEEFRKFLESYKLL